MFVVIPLALASLFMQACTPARGPQNSIPTAPSSNLDAGDGASYTAALHTTGTATSGDTATESTTPPPLELPEPTPGVMTPTSRLIPTHEIGLTSTFGSIAIPDAQPLLSVGVTGADRSAIYLDDLPPPGDQAILDVWDGLSMGGPHHEIIPVPDVNGDGVYDYWAFYKLLPGPIIGTDVGIEAYYGSAIAQLSPDHIRGPLGFGEVVLSNFDADDDGHIDILVDNGGANNYEVYFGPFEGEITENLGTDDKTNLGTGDSSECHEPPIFLPDLFGPGEHGVAVGGEDWPRWCPRDRFVVPLAVDRTGSRGEVGSIDFPVGHLQPVGDLDGNGSQDLIAFSYWFEPLSGLWSAPFDEQTSFAQLTPPPATESTDRGGLMGSIGDVNADGVDDLLGYTNPRYAYGGEHYDNAPATYVLLSPFDDPIVIDEGIPVEPMLTIVGGAHIPWAHGDFDGDGHSDLVYVPGKELQSSEYDPPETVLVVYSGADLTAADPRTTP
jgi:hypothetical protein